MSCSCVSCPRTWALLRCLIPLHLPHAPLHSDGRTALSFASGKGHSAVVHALIAAKADVNARAKYNNAVLFAAHLSTVALLAPLHLPHAWLHSDGQTALFYAVDEGHVSIAKTLIAAKADVNAKAK
jgi:serine/threonine-protein phosphatase 6 regulatory ankyrin repeat subunit B